MLKHDLLYTILLFAIAAGVAVAYGIRVLLRGKAQYDRVDKQGASPLLNKSVMEGGYWFFQPLGRLLVACHVTPNQISWGSLAFGILAGACLAVGHFGFGAGFATISAIFDALDGIVARETGVASDAGEVLDATVDRYVEFFFLGGLVIYYREIPALLALALAALVGAFMVSYSTAKAEALQVEAPKSSMRRPERALYLTLGAALSPITIPIWEQIREYPVAIGHPMVAALGLVAVLANVSAIERLWAIARNVRELEAKALEAKRQALQSDAESSGDEHPAKIR
jgi:phosphatidylglycerophosphate synthase